MPPSDPRRPRPLVVLVAAAALALGGCGDDADFPTSTAASTPTAAATTTSTGAPPTTTGATATTGPTETTTAGTTSTATTSTSVPIGNEDDYVRTLDAICKRVASESQDFVAELSRIGDTDASIDAVKGPMTRFFAAVGERYQELAAARPPRKWQAYQASLRGDAEGVQRYLAEATRVISEARSTADLAKLRALMARTSFSTGDAPPALAKRTPACNPLGTGGSSTG